MKVTVKKVNNKENLFNVSFERITKGQLLALYYSLKERETKSSISADLVVFLESAFKTPDGKNYLE